MVIENGNVDKLGKCTGIARKLEGDDEFKVRLIIMLFSDHTCCQSADWK